MIWLSLILHLVAVYLFVTNQMTMGVIFFVLGEVILFTDYFRTRNK